MKVSGIGIFLLGLFALYVVIALCSGDDGTAVVIGAMVFPVYFLPAMVAARRRHANRGAICTLNLLLGWTMVGWVIAMVWSMTANTQKVHA